MQRRGGIGHSSGTADTGGLTERVNRQLVEVHSRGLADLGADGSGLFDLYAALVRGGEILRTVDLAAFRLVREALPAFAEYVVLEAGLGELALLPKEAGLQVIACEKNAKRFQALTASCGGQFPGGEGGGLRLVEEFLPDTFDLHPVLGIATDFAYNVDSENDNAFRESLRQFDAVLVNPRLFFRLRNSAAEQWSGLTFLGSLGFVEVTEYPELELVFAVRPAVQPGQGEGEILSDSLIDPVLNSVLERIMDLVPAPAPEDRSTTWVERRIREFDMKSAFGNGE